MAGIISGRSNVNSDEINLACWKPFSVKIALFITGLFCIKREYYNLFNLQGSPFKLVAEAAQSFYLSQRDQYR